VSDPKIAERIRALLQEGPMTATEIHCAVGRNVVGLADTLFTMADLGHVQSETVRVGVGRPRTIWQLPSEPQAVAYSEAAPASGRILLPVEVDRLILALVRGSGDLGASEQDIETVCDWALRLPETNRALMMVLDGKLWLRVYGPHSKGEISFIAPTRV
jgi:hypothetical protein